MNIPILVDIKIPNISLASKQIRIRLLMYLSILIKLSRKAFSTSTSVYPAPILIKLSRKAPHASTSANPAPFRDTWRAFFKLLILTHGGSYGLMVYLSPSRYHPSSPSSFQPQSEGLCNRKITFSFNAFRSSNPTNPTITSSLQH